MLCWPPARGCHAHFFRPLDVRPAARPDHFRALGHPANQVERSSAGDGPGNGHLVSPGRGRFSAVCLSRCESPVTTFSAAGTQGRLAAGAGYRRADGQLRAVSGRTQSAQPRDHATGDPGGADTLADQQPVRLSRALQPGSGDWPDGHAARLRPVLQSAPG